MSNTKFARQHQLRYDDLERSVLVRLLMVAIEERSRALAASGGGTEQAKREVRAMRSLLERI